jgi:hypothetical protein
MLGRAAASVIAIALLRSVPTGAQEPRATPNRITTVASWPIAHFRDAREGFTQYSGISDSSRLVIRDAASWKSYWNAIHRPFIPAPPPPEVDFTREIVVLAAMGTRPTGGFAIRIDSAVTDSARVLVLVRQVIPGTGCAVPAVVTQPVDLVRIPATGLPVSFTERLERTDCPAASALRRP